MRFRFHGDKCVGRVAVADCASSSNARRQDAGAVVAGQRNSLTLDDLEKIANRPPRTLAELADKIRNFWSRQ